MLISPTSPYAARYNLDLDLITRGSGFGYYGSVVTNVIFATFTFIFFAPEGSIMAQGLNLGLHVPLGLGYAPPRTPQNSRRWWTAMILAGPGWVIFGAIKQIVGLFLAVLVHSRGRTRSPA